MSALAYNYHDDLDFEWESMKYRDANDTHYHLNRFKHPEYDTSPPLGLRSTVGNNKRLRRYVHGGGMDKPLVWYEGTTKRYLHADNQGSVIATTDASGGLLNISTYDGYGVRTNTNANYASRVGYTGQIDLPEVGLTYYKARIYNPTLGRFLQSDPIGYGAGLNLYAYVGGDPINTTDPLGLQETPHGTVTVRSHAKTCTEDPDQPKCPFYYDPLAGLSPPHWVRFDEYARQNRILQGIRNWAAPSNPADCAVGIGAAGTAGAGLGAGVGGLAGGSVGLVVAAPTGETASFITVPAFSTAGAATGANLCGQAGVACGYLANSSCHNGGNVVFNHASGGDVDRQRNGSPSNNQAQNRQVDGVLRKLEQTRSQRQLLHREISGQNYSYQEIRQIAREMFGK